MMCNAVLSFVRGLLLPRISVFTALLAALVLSGLRLDAASPIRLQWQNLSTVVGRTVSIAMPGGVVVKGEATGVESDALLVNVKSTTDAKAYPRGPLRVPRATLHRFDMRTKGKKFRILGTVLGAGVGLTGGSAAAWGIEGGVLGNEHGGLAVAALFGIWAGGTVAGYFAGNEADKHWTAVEVLE